MLTQCGEPTLIRLSICWSCFDSNDQTQALDFKGLLDGALDAAGLPQPIQTDITECLGSCEKPFAVTLQGQGMASYVFAGLSGPDEIPDLVETVRLYAESPQGMIGDARRCGRIRHLLRARLPVLT